MGGIPIERLQEKWDPEEIRLEDSPLLGGYMFNHIQAPATQLLCKMNHQNERKGSKVELEKDGKLKKK